MRSVEPDDDEPVTEEWLFEQNWDMSSKGSVTTGISPEGVRVVLKTRTGEGVLWCWSQVIRLNPTRGHVRILQSFLKDMTDYNKRLNTKEVCSVET